MVVIECIDRFLCDCIDALYHIENFVLYTVRADEDCSWRERERVEILKTIEFYREV